MARYYLEVISSILKVWKEYGLVRYYYNNWLRFLSDEDRFGYKARYGLAPDDEDNGIKVYFDESGRLHVDNCHDDAIRHNIEHGMDGWYHWAEEQFRMKHSGERRIIDLVGPYMRVIKPGYYQVKYGQVVFNMDEDQKGRLEYCGYVVKDWNTDEEYVSTGYSNLDSIVMSIINDSKETQDNLFYGTLFDQSGHR